MPKSNKRKLPAEEIVDKEGDSSDDSSSEEEVPDNAQPVDEIKKLAKEQKELKKKMDEIKAKKSGLRNSIKKKEKHSKAVSAFGPDVHKFKTTRKKISSSSYQYTVSFVVPRTEAKKQFGFNRITKKVIQENKRRKTIAKAKRMDNAKGRKLSAENERCASLFQAAVTLAGLVYDKVKKSEIDWNGVVSRAYKFIEEYKIPIDLAVVKGDENVSKFKIAVYGQ